jgi:DNA-binding NtrC family response regulator
MLDLGGMMDSYRVLVVDDDEVAVKTLTRLLSKEGYDVVGARGGAQALTILGRTDVDVVVSDLVMGEIDGLELLSRVKAQDPDIEVIVITGHASISTAIEAVRNGAYHYAEKPVRPEQVRHLVSGALEKASLKRRVRELESRAHERPTKPMLIGESRAISEVVRLIRQVAPSDCSVLINGESGTGKELVASLIHHHSRRSRRRFLAINCGAFAEELLANELFGHEKGAFTGASRDKAGILESSSGGTLLLDEVGDMPQAMQAKLLRAVEEQEVIRVGGTRPIPIDVRLVGATHRDLRSAVNAGLFRHDLYYRLNVVSIAIPPLRDRREDIPLLAHFFLHRIAEEAGKKVTGFTDAALQALTEYSFPGNVRELENIIQRAVVVAADNLVRVRDLPPDLTEMAVFSFDAPDGDIRTLRQVQAEYIQWVLDRVDRNKSRAAKLLGIDRSSLWRHLKNREIED